MSAAIVIRRILESPLMKKIAILVANEIIKIVVIKMQKSKRKGDEEDSHCIVKTP